ncbi:ubiquinol-cytochrome c reductase iron-sulfur subunit [Rhodomicrobium sp. Az07]|uniref:ubiquinol-cytochrome c reductase iron-sulfur subunit n=1 Tax=Rhodomicrobium sp. Az07 TaxID=2839034 RepID=UPI001BECE2FB|nr:ubiquinol-cytochrome c reductase iron-sulfur subunit [Rhodomicrobium sp. Az07]MBT3069972.1 ubiquinol-cytochrome c reductase iron-sulfur subunit [Rhodomicrobium sp. Az07]
MATTYDGDQGDVSRRDFIYLATTAFAAVGAAAALWPLIDQMNPDASALSLASIDVDLTPVPEGAAITVLWRGKPVFIRHRTAEEVKKAQEVPIADLKDPYAQVEGAPSDLPATDANRTKAGNEQWLVLIGICTHLGCVPKGQAPGDERGPYGGWFCPCHGSAYDTAGRIRQGPAPRNLDVPPYAFATDTKILIG